MEYLKFKEGTKDRCLEAMDRLNNDALFKYVVESLLEPSIAHAEKELVESDIADPRLPTLQGSARVLKEFVDLSRTALTLRAKRKKQ